MSCLSPDQVLALAPDASAAAAARGVADASKWASAGVNEDAAWGEAKGSGKLPYQTAVDLKNLAYKCSCPSRKLPCKHALGLLLRHANNGVSPAEPPGWVQEWLEKRAERSTKQAERAEATPDSEAAAKRAEKRWSNILTGLDECESFLSDVVSQGLLSAQSARSWDQMAARMVDAQAPGVASRLKRIGAAIGVGDRWGHAVTGQIGSLSLLMEAARRVEALEEGLKADVLTTLGIPTKKENLTGEKVADVWDVLGQIVEVEDRISTCRSWLKARSSGRWAMHLSFSVAGQPYDFRPLPESALAARVQYYPSAWPLRVHVDDQEIVPFQPTGGGQMSECLELACQAWERNPWADLVPVHLGRASLARDGQSWYVVDEDGVSVRLQGAVPFDLLAMTGNAPCNLHGEWNGTSLRLLSAWGAWGYLAL